MMPFKRSDSRVTICSKLAMLVAQIGNPGEHAYRAGNRSQRIADFMRDGRRQPAHGREPVLHADFPFQPPDFGQVVEGIDVANRLPAGDCQARKPCTRKSCGNRCDATNALLRVRVRHRPGQGVEKQLTEQALPEVGFRRSNKLLRGRIDQRDVSVEPGRDQTAADRRMMFSCNACRSSRAPLVCLSFTSTWRSLAASSPARYATAR